MHRTVVRFFTIVALNGVPKHDDVGVWSARGFCEQYRIEYIIRQRQRGIEASTTLCAKREGPRS